MAQRFEVNYSPLRAAERVARWSGVVRARLIMLGVTAIIAGGLWWWRRDSLGTWGLTLITCAVAIPVVWIVVAFVLEVLAKRDLARVGEGVALTMDSQGVAIAGDAMPWTEVEKFTTRPGGPGSSALVVVKGRGGRHLRIPLEHLDAGAGDLDNAARAYTAGRVGLDLTAIGV